MSDNKTDILIAFYKEHCGHHEDAAEGMDFIIKWLEYIHWIDDAVDGELDEFPAEIFVTSLLKCGHIYNHGFFIKYMADLSPLVINAANDYLDSVVMEKSIEGWKKQFADVLRTSGNGILTTVVRLLAGWEKSREFSQLIREASYIKHHTKEGEPI